MALYRFRNTRRLLGSKELEEQYLFFASSDSQNDPSEGIVDFYWQGDSVAWMGLVKNYAWQILWLLFSWPACRNALEIKELVYLRRSGYCLEGTQIDSMRLEVEKRIAHDERIIAFVDALGNFGFKLLARHLIHEIIPSIHIIALYYADQVLQENGIKTIFPQSVRKSLFDKENAYKMLNAMLQIIGEGYDSLEKTSRLNETMMPEFEYYQSKLMISNVERLGEEVKGAFEIIQFVVSFFPQEYVKLITRLVFPEWYCICFCEAIEDPALWSYYADGHKGVCLIFDNDLRIKSPKKTNNDRRFVAEKVVYGNPTADFNFFRGLGALFGDEREHWLIHEGQRRSILHVERCRSPHE